MCDESGACYTLPPGEHELEMEEAWEGPHCGIFPMQGEANVKTHGLKWDFDQKLAMGILWVEEINAAHLSTE